MQIHFDLNGNMEKAFVPVYFKKKKNTKQTKHELLLRDIKRASVVANQISAEFDSCKASKNVAGTTKEGVGAVQSEASCGILNWHESGTGKKNKN